MHEYECYVYIVASLSRTLYIGMTGRLQARIADHQNRAFEGFSKDYRCTRLVYFERCTGPTAAILREKQLKGWTRAKKIALIEKANPTWVDLSDAWSQPVGRYRWAPEELARWKEQCSAGKEADPSTSLRSAQDDG
ncbi:MAG: GIY-YIG nuclease family protein [Janthinobacterium lividum]